VEDVLFSGDVLFYRQVGRTDLLGGSKDNIAKSVRRLYTELPGSTKVYPGHGEFTDIGTERTENQEVRIDGATIKN
jgi:glyoxylase-like metal-dependent hydrolase (beta-lactamase superfamily II)